MYGLFPICPAVHGPDPPTDNKFYVPSFKSVHDDQMSHVTYPEERMISKGLIQKQSENEWKWIRKESEFFLEF